MNAGAVRQPSAAAAPMHRLSALVGGKHARPLPRPRTIAGPKPQQPLRQGPDREPGNNIAGPMREQDDPGGDQPGANGPDQVALGGSEHGGGGAEGADVKGVAGGKGIEALSGKYVFGQFPQYVCPENRGTWIFAHIKLGRRVFLAQPNACRSCAYLRSTSSTRVPISKL